MAKDTKVVTVTAPAQPMSLQKLRSSRFLRGTDVYIAEFILWLIVAGATLGTLVSLWYAFFGVMNASGSTGHDMAMTIVSGLGSLVILLPLAYVLRLRVQGEEARNAARQTQRSRTVFLTMWVLVTILGLFSMLAMVISSIFSSFYGFGGSISDVYVGSVVPSLLGAITLAAGSVLVLKRARGRLMQASWLTLGVVVLVLFVGGFIVAAVHKDDKDAPHVCAYSSYTQSSCFDDTYNSDNSAQGQSSPYDKLFDSSSNNSDSY